MTLELIRIEYLGEKRVFILEEGHGGNYFIRIEGKDILNPHNPFKKIPSQKDIRDFFRSTQNE